MSGYYAWRKRQSSRHRRADVFLAAKLVEAFQHINAFLSFCTLLRHWRPFLLSLLELISLRIPWAVHDAFMTLPPYTRIREGEVHKLGHGVRKRSRRARSRPLSETSESIERECPAPSAEGTARCASRGFLQSLSAGNKRFAAWKSIVSDQPEDVLLLHLRYQSTRTVMRQKANRIKSNDRE